MISFDTDILLYAQNQDCAEHSVAVAFLEDCARRHDVAICELVLVELYQLLRNFEDLGFETVWDPIAGRR